jgi:hypothetical protein
MHNPTLIIAAGFKIYVCKDMRKKMNSRHMKRKSEKTRIMMSFDGSSYMIEFHILSITCMRISNL